MMKHKFSRHYTREQARDLLPRVREWLERLFRLRDELRELDRKLSSLVGAGDDIGGSLVNRWLRVLAETKRVLSEFQSREIQIKDVDRGLVDFPAILGGREVFLCWEKDDQDIEYWHDLDSGYAGRERF
ncbi:MAG TPA: DUF2203 domain-containing protein [Methylomirabilota bacterium]|nr:DUF2203 domain-containing protein [Methylomirabilota bacterium]